MSKVPGGCRHFGVGDGKGGCWSGPVLKHLCLAVEKIADYSASISSRPTRFTNITYALTNKLNAKHQRYNSAPVDKVVIQTFNRNFKLYFQYD